MEDEEDDFDESFFVNDLPRDLRCPVCLYGLKDPCQMSCGHRICSKCIEDLKSNSEILTCPVDRQTVQGGIFPDMAAKMQMNSLKVRCSNFKKGCSWTGDLSDRKTHLQKTCRYISRNCPLCKEMLQMIEFDRHQKVCPMRPYECEHCDMKFPFSNRERHYSLCESYPVPCPNECSSSELPRYSVSDHLQKDCPLQLVSCTLKAFGCEEKIQRKDMESHLKNCAIKQMSSLAAVVLRQEQEIAELRESLHHCQLSLKKLDSTCYPSHGQFTWKIENIRQKIMEAQRGVLDTPNSLIYSPPFFTGEGGYKLCLCIYPAGDNNQQCLSLYFVVMKGPFDDILQWPFQKHVRLFLINCRGGQSIVKDINPDPRLHYFRRPKEEKNVGYGYPRLISLQRLLSEDSEFVTTDAIFIRANIYL